MKSSNILEKLLRGWSSGIFRENISAGTSKSWYIWIILSRQCVGRIRDAQMAYISAKALDSPDTSWILVMHCELYRFSDFRYRRESANRTRIAWFLSAQRGWSSLCNSRPFRTDHCKCTASPCRSPPNFAYPRKRWWVRCRFRSDRLGNLRCQMTAWQTSRNWYNPSAW